MMKYKSGSMSPENIGRAYDSLVLFSGGIDSAVCLEKEIRKTGGNTWALHFRYGQPHALELDYAIEFIRARDCMFCWVELPVPESGITDQGETAKGNPVVHGRNLMFLSYALAFAISRKIRRIVIGSTLEDQELFSDCRPGFFKAFNRMAILLGDIRVDAPLINMSKRSVFQVARELGIDDGETWSCYFPTDAKGACGECLACGVRNKAIAGLK